MRKNKDWSEKRRIIIFLLLLRLRKERKNWNSNGICCWLSAVGLIIFLRFAFLRAAIVMLTYHEVLCRFLRQLWGKEEERTFPAGINVISFVSEENERAKCFLVSSLDVGKLNILCSTTRICVTTSARIHSRWWLLNCDVIWLGVSLIFRFRFSFLRSPMDRLFY